ncbi:MAG TPA: hypothetical protein PKD53_25895 [Chloroflexaceae bacterium]|nr:hypothetical protein [Chloroflexaceae bacterium]
MHTRNDTPGRARALALVAASIILFGAGALAGVGLSRLVDGQLLFGALFTLLGAAVAWATIALKPARGA